MGVNLKKPQHIILFAVIMPAFTLWLNQFVIYLPNLPWWIEKPSPILIYGVIFLFFEHYFWQWPPFYWLRVVEVPNLSGRWKGTQMSSYRKNGENVEVEGVIEITQTFSELNFRTYYKKMDSKRIVACFDYSTRDKYLYYTYEAEVNIHKEGTMQNHLGTARVECVTNGTKKELRGKYFNDAGNHGDMIYQFESKKLKHCL